MRASVSATGLYTYPDVVVVCGEPRFLDGRQDTLLNPTFPAEVLSPSETYDRGRKFEHYRSIESLQLLSDGRIRPPTLQTFIPIPVSPVVAGS
jgi:Uma2 family endonuclease